MKSLSAEKEDNAEMCEPLPKITLNDILSSIKSMHALTDSTLIMTKDTILNVSVFKKVRNWNTDQTVLDRYFKQVR